VVLAEGLPVESYLDIGDRSNFHRDGEAIRLFPEFASWSGSDAAQRWETRGTAPLVMVGDRLEAARLAVTANLARDAALVRGYTDGCGSPNFHRLKPAIGDADGQRW